MKAHPIGTATQSRRSRTATLWCSLLAGLLVIAVAALPGLRASRAQTPSSPAVAVQNAASSMQGASAQEPALESQAKQDVNVSATDERKRLIADESANLLNLARSLKTEMDKTTKDTLSVTVVRKAGEIEQLAHRMRTK